MSERVRRALAAALCMLALALISRVPMGAAPTHALLRLSWQTEGERIKELLETDPNLPAHMRAPGGNYEFRLVPYRLLVKVDGQTRLDRLVTPSGVHQDRPLSVLAELPLPVRSAKLDIEFVPAVPLESPTHLYRLSGEVNVEAAEVLLVTLDESDRLIFVEGRPSGERSGAHQPEPLATP